MPTTTSNSSLFYFLLRQKNSTTRNNSLWRLYGCQNAPFRAHERGNSISGCAPCDSGSCSSKTNQPMSTLDQLAKSSIIVADTGDLDLIKELKPQDATTNPSLILKAAKNPKFAHLIDEAVAFAKTKPKEQADWALDRVSVNFGLEISKLVPGYVSTEVDARLAFKSERTYQRAKNMIAMYKEKGVDTSRILIKIAATWQGTQAAEKLEKEGIKTNLTLVFNCPGQAYAAAQSNLTLISPFVGRVGDYYKKIGMKVEGDPGVKLVKEINDYYKKHGIKTIVMAASVRTVEQAVAMAGVDRMTIPPEVLKQLKESKVPCPKALNTPMAPERKKQSYLDDRHYYMRVCRDDMATHMLQQGIMAFVKDTNELEKILKKKLAAAAPAAPAAKL
eukprot:g27544.t1